MKKYFKAGRKDFTMNFVTNKQFSEESDGVSSYEVIPMESSLMGAPYITEQEMFQQELERFSQYVFGKDCTQLIVYMTDAMRAYLKFLTIGSRSYANSQERWQAILQQMTAGEYIQAMMISSGGKQ